MFAYALTHGQLCPSQWASKYSKDAANPETNSIYGCFGMRLLNVCALKKVCVRGPQLQTYDQQLLYIKSLGDLKPYWGSECCSIVNHQ